MLIKQCRLVVLHFLKDRFHEGLADEATAIRYATDRRNDPARGAHSH